MKTYYVKVQNQEYKIMKPCEKQPMIIGIMEDLILNFQVAIFILFKKTHCMYYNHQEPIKFQIM